MIHTLAGAPPAAPTPISKRELVELDDRVLNCAFSALAQLGTSWIINSTVLLEVGSVSTALAIGCLPLALLVALTVYKMGMYLAVSERFIEGKIENPFDDNLLDNCTYYSKLAVVNWFGCRYLNVFLHELGHAAAMKCLWKNVDTTIIVRLFGGGRCSASLGELSALGKALGPLSSHMLMLGGGIMASTFVAMTEFLISVYLRNKSLFAAEIVEMHGMSQLLGDILYGIRSLKKPNPDSDFTRMHKDGGLHPLIPILTMILLPLMEYVLLCLWHARKEKKESAISWLV